jgi:hypothetical protein
MTYFQEHTYFDHYFSLHLNNFEGIFYAKNLIEKAASTTFIVQGNV